jgi:hypothetical protein
MSGEGHPPKNWLKRVNKAVSSLSAKYRQVINRNMSIAAEEQARLDSIRAEAEWVHRQLRDFKPLVRQQDDDFVRVYNRHGDHF